MKSQNTEIIPAGTLITKPTYNVIQIEQVPDFVNNTYCTDISNTAIIKKIEKLARNSLEYKNYFKYLKTNLDMSRCSYLPMIKTGIGDIRTELHHSPFTMFDITKIVCNKHIIDHKYASEFEVAEEVMMLHYSNMVGLIPLSPTVHELVHSGNIEIHPDLVYGNWREFINIYKEYFPDDLKDKINYLNSFDNISTDKIPDILSVKSTMLEYKNCPAMLENLNI